MQYRQESPDFPLANQKVASNNGIRPFGFNNRKLGERCSPAFNATDLKIEWNLRLLARDVTGYRASPRRII